VSLGAVLILGARSDIARATAHRFAGAGHPVQLAARGANDLEADAADLRLRYGVIATVHEYDALDRDPNAFVNALPTLPDIAICAVGLMGSQAECEGDPTSAAIVIRSNFEGPAAMLGELATRFAARESGTLVGISSVAGLRGRASNYVYGAAKAGFTAYLSGLRNRLAGQGVHVVTVLPGFVETRMTEGLDLPRRLTASPGEVADAIFAAVTRRRNVIYVKPMWRWIMLAIRLLPEPLFKRTRL
jgi:short-subunit dehydrogenase